MTHQNRSKLRNRPGDNPTPEMVLSLREKHALTQDEFGKLGFHSQKSVDAWESGERPMHPLVWLAYQHVLDGLDFKRP